MILLISLCLIMGLQPYLDTGLFITQVTFIISLLLTCFLGIMNSLEQYIEQEKIKAGEYYDATTRNAVGHVIFALNIAVTFSPQLLALSSFIASKIFVLNLKRKEILLPIGQLDDVEVSPASPAVTATNVFSPPAVTATAVFSPYGVSSSPFLSASQFVLSNQENATLMPQEYTPQSSLKKSRFPAPRLLKKTGN